MIVNRVEIHKISKSSQFFVLIDDMCFQSKNIYNYANYIIRQEFISNGNYIKRFDMQKIVKDADCYKSLGSNTGQVTLQMLNFAWTDYFKSIKDYKQYPNKYLGRPKLPKYKDKNGRYMIGLTNNKFKIIDGYVYFGWKKLKFMNNYFMTRIPKDAKLIQIRFIPKHLSYNMEIVYQIEIPDFEILNNRIVSIDIGVDNFITISNNFGEKPIVIKGGTIKSINQFYNKKKAEIQSQIKTQNKLDWCKRLSNLSMKRYCKIKYQMHCISRFVINYCKENNIDTIVIGYNKQWKQSNIGKQNFVYIPYNLFIQMLKYKCEENKINFITTEESYTSGTSFLDGELPIKDNYDKSRRVYRGLFISNNGKKINADVNGAYQIMKKVFPDIFNEGIEGAYSHPMVVKLTP